MSDTSGRNALYEQSESIGNLAKALVTFHGGIESIPKDSNNPFFKSKYASLDTIIETIRPHLTKAGLTFAQFPIGSNALTSIIIDSESGEWIRATYSMQPSKNDPQGVGSAITYMRRYALGAMLGLTTTVDDDANSASNKLY